MKISFFKTVFFCYNTKRGDTMTQKEKLQKSLLRNLILVGILFGIITILFVYKLYSMYYASPTLYDIQTNLIFKDYLVFLLFGMGVLAMGSSVLFYFKAHQLHTRNQIRLLVAVGIMLFPFTLLMVLTGLMIGIDNPKYQANNSMVGIFTMFIFLIVYSLVLVDFTEPQAIYTESKVYSFEYINDEDHIEWDVEVVFKQGELLKIEIDSIANLRHPEVIDPFLKELALFLQADSRTLCYSLIHNTQLTDEESNCEINFPDPDYSNIVFENIDQFSDFTLFVFYRDMEDGVDTDILNIRSRNEVYHENYYDKD